MGSAFWLKNHLERERLTSKSSRWGDWMATLEAIELFIAVYDEVNMRFKLDLVGPSGVELGLGWIEKV